MISSVKASKTDRFGHNSQWISADAKIQRIMLYAHRCALFIIEMYRDFCKKFIWWSIFPKNAYKSN